MADGRGVSGDDVVAGGDESDDATADTACCDAGGIGLASVIGLVSGEEVGQGMGKSEGFEVGATELFGEDVEVQTISRRRRELCGNSVSMAMAVMLWEPARRKWSAARRSHFRRWRRGRAGGIDGWWIGGG